MSHQPFELWLFDDEELEQTQKSELNQHIKSCPQCQQLQENWEDVRNVMKTLPVAAPSDGFSQRWRLSVEARRELKERSQLWKFFLVITGALFVTLVVLACQVFSAGSPMNWLVFAVQNGVNILGNLVSFLVVLLSWKNVVPTPLTIILWLMTVGLLLAISVGLVLATKRLLSRKTRTFLE